MASWRDDGEFAFFGGGEHGVGLGEGGAGGGGDEVGGHDFGDGGVQVGVELNVAGGYDAEEATMEGAVFCDRLSANMDIFDKTDILRAV